MWKVYSVGLGRLGTGERSPVRFLSRAPLSNAAGGVTAQDVHIKRLIIILLKNHGFI